MSPTIDTVENVLDLVKEGQYISAIKMYREIKGVSLSEAKEYVDKLRFGQEIKLLKSNSIDQMKDRISKMYMIDENQKNFLLDLTEEAYFLGEDTGEQTGYHKAITDNDFGVDSERDDQVAEEAYDEGWSEGHNQGMEEGHERGEERGYESGYNDGKEEGYDEGYNEGKVEGHESGHQSGLEEGRAERNE